MQQILSYLRTGTYTFREVSRYRLLMLVPALLISASGVYGQVVFQANATSGCTPLGVVINVTSPSAASISSYSWVITTPSGSQLTASTAQYVAIFSQPGNYDVSLTINGSQNQTINDYITVHSKPTANFTVNDQSGCFPLCVDFSDLSISSDGALTEWSWDFGDGGTSNDQNPSYCYNQVGTFSPVFSVEDEFGCFASLSMPGMIQVVNNFPVAAFSMSSQLDCNPPVNIQFTNTSSGTSALNSYWNFDDGSDLNQAGTPAATHTFQSTGNYDVCLTVTDQIGCEKTICKPLEIFDNPTAAFTTSTNTACEGVPISFQNTTSPAPPQVQWDFNGDGIIDSNNQNASYSYLNSGTYSPSMIVTYSAGCKDTLTLNSAITITDGVSVSFVADTLAACSVPFTVNFTNTSVGQGAISYAWYVDNVLVGNSTDYTHTFNDYGSYSIKLISTNASGCVNQHVISDYILVEAPTVSFENAVSVCTNQEVPVFNVDVVSVDPVAFYFWDFNGDGVTDAQGPSPGFAYSNPGTFNITLTIETINGCSATYTNTQSISVLTQVNATFSSSTTVTCAGEPIEFCVDEQPGNTFSWNFYDGSGWVIMALDEDCIMHDYADTGYFDLTLTVFNGACNVLQTFEDFIYVAPPLAKFEYFVDCTDLQSVQFFDTSIGADSIVWDFGDGSPPVINVTDPIHVYPTQGVYSVTLTAYNTELGCPDVKITDIAVAAPNASVSISPTSGCPPLSVLISPDNFNTNWEITVSNGDHIAANWLPNMNQWQVNYSHDDTLENFMVSGMNSPFIPLITIEDGGFHDVLVEVVDANGCITSEFYDDVIHVAANPDFASFNANILDACETVNISFEPTISNLQSTQWIFSDGTFSGSNNPVKTFLPPYNYNGQLSATLTATDASGCTSTVTQLIDIVLPPAINFSVTPMPQCIGTEILFTNNSTGPSSTTWMWDFGDPLSPNNSSSDYEASHSYSENGNYTVCLTADNGAGCVKTVCSPQQVQIRNPEVDFTFSPSINNCLYIVQFTNTTPGTSTSTIWNYGDDQMGAGQSVFHTYPLGVYDVSLTVTNQYGCVDSLSIPDIFNYGNQIGPYTQLLDSANCAPFEVQFASFNPNDTYFTYFWDFNDGSGDPTGNTLSEHTYMQPGTYCPSVIMTDPNGCNVLIGCTEPIVVDEFVLSYNTAPYICYGDTLMFQVDNGTSYQWNNSGFVTAGNNFGEYYLHPEDDFTFLLTGTFADCERTDTIHLEVRDLPHVTLDLPALVCHNDSIIELNTGLPNDPSGTYFIDGVEANVFDPAMTPGLSYEVQYTWVDTFQCSANAVQNIFIKSLPVLDFPDLNPVCEDAPEFVLNTATPAGGTYYLGTEAVTDFAPLQYGEGNYTFQYQYTDSDGCSNAINSSLIVHPLPDIEIVFEDVCMNSAFEIENNTSIPLGSISQNLWDFGAYGTHPGETPQPFYFNEIGIHNFSLTATSAIGCVNVLDTMVHVWAVPEGALTPDFTCEDTPSVFYDISTIEEGDVVASLWQTNGVLINSSDSLVYTYPNWGEIPLTLFAISDHGCADTITVDIDVNPSPVVVLEFDNNCFGDESILFAAESIALGAVESREWQFGDDHENEYEAAADNLYEEPGTYQLQYTAVSNLGCVTVVHDEIEIYHVPESEPFAEVDHICAGESFSLFDLSSVGGNSVINEWTWWLDQNQISTSQNPVVSYDTPGHYDLTLTVRTDDGCTADSTINLAIIVYPNPTAGFTSNDEATMINPGIQVVNTASEDVTEWHYDFGDGQTEVWSEGEHYYDQWNVYTVTQTVRNTFGCADTMQKQVEIIDHLLIYIPNAFTPDNNGHNELFYPVISGMYLTHYEFQVFNRWGRIVFSSNQQGEGWNGVDTDAISSDGAYSWSLSYKTEKSPVLQRKTGSVLLLR